MKKMFIAVMAIVLVTVACGGDETAPASTTATTVAEPTTTEGMAEVSIGIASFAFGPDTITIPVGTTVTWINDEDSVDHTTTSDDALWDSGTLKPGDQFSFTFEDAGTFAYFCNIHPSMTGMIVVEG